MSVPFLLQEHIHPQYWVGIKLRHNIQPLNIDAKLNGPSWFGHQHWGTAAQASRLLYHPELQHGFYYFLSYNLSQGLRGRDCRYPMDNPVHLPRPN